ncbi:MAG: L,D-transpeptidase [Bacteroidales bacterium]|nr:L,D-transpeptidase [Bacteroidales bacterium]
MNRKWLKPGFWLFTLLTIIALGWLILIKLQSKSPALDIALAREKLSEARAVGAEIYATIIFDEATALYDSANLIWKRENEKYFFMSEYSRAEQLAQLSVKQSEASIKKAISYSGNLRKNLEKELRRYNEKCRMFEKQFDQLPLDKELRSSFLSAQMSLKEAELAFSNLNYNLCIEKLKITKEEIDFTFTITKQLLEEYFTMYGLWSDLNAQALNYSTQHHDYALVVSKFQKKCFLYYAGKEEASYDIELGKNWIGDKRHKGDKSTPEGLYHIVEKKSGKQTKYHKALLINFPNTDDKIRFAAEKKNGTIPKNLDIGGLIELHGEGGKGTNWTDGCIAFSNEDIDQLYVKVNKGTPIFIIGSLQTLDKIIVW